MILDVRGTAKNKQTNKQTWDGGSRSNVFPRCRCSVIKAEKSRSSFLCESERPWQTDAAAAADDGDDRDEEEVEEEQGHVPQQKKISPSRGGSGRCWESGGRQAKSQLQKTLLALCLQPSGGKIPQVCVGVAAPTFCRWVGANQYGTGLTAAHFSGGLRTSHSEKWQSEFLQDI